MLHVAICEDSPQHLEVIQALLDKYQTERPNVELCTHSFSSGAEMLGRMDGGHRFDLFLLDILMPEKSGVELARDLRERSAGTPLIFMTSSEEYMREAFEVWAIQYILKPITVNKLFPVLDRILPTLLVEDEPILIFPTPGRMVNVPLASVIYAELVERTVSLTLQGDERLLSSTIRTSFAEAVAPLLDDERFLYPHKSFVINMAHVKALGNASFTMKNDVQIPIPRYRYTEVKAKYLAFLSGRGANLAQK